MVDGPAQTAEARPRPVRLGEERIVVDRRADGSIIVRQTDPLDPYPHNLTERLVHWATATPDNIYLAARAPGGEWRQLTYAQTLGRVRRLGQALLDAGLSAERPLVILSGNDIEHALLALAAYHVGIPYAPISPAYSLVSTDFGKLRDIFAALTPGMVFAADGRAYANALQAVAQPEIPVVVTRNPPSGRAVRLFDAFEAVEPTPAVEQAFRATGPDTIAKFLFTSGSTGSPKAVINTQRMLCANQAMVRACYAFLQDERPVVLDWAPWNHTAGGNKTFGMVLYNGGAFYIDDGRPTPDGIEATVRNLREVAPNWYFNVPKGLEELVPRLRADAGLRRTFFSRLKMIVYAGAGLAQHTWDALERLSIETTGERVLISAGLGSTETAPFALMCTTPQTSAGNCGVPARGVELKLVPFEGKYDARIRGPNVTPGYWRAPELTAGAFDEEGFYRLGDALRFADPDDASQGFFFDGRTAENFKLDTGTWVGVGALRAAFIDHFGSLARDVVFAGPDRPEIGALVLPDVAECRKLAPAAPADLPVADLLAKPEVADRFRNLLLSFNGRSTGSSTAVRRLVLMHEPPSLDRGEVTDKGSLNQRAMLNVRADLVEELYAGVSLRVIFPAYAR